MIDGVIVLYQENAFGFSPIIPKIFLILVFIFLFFGVINIWISTKNHSNSSFDTGIMLISLAVLCILSCIATKRFAPYTKYKVTIAPSVSYTEFIQHYKLISQEGDIYSIRLIEEK